MLWSLWLVCEKMLGFSFHVLRCCRTMCTVPGNYIVVAHRTLLNCNSLMGQFKKPVHRNNISKKKIWKWIFSKAYNRRLMPFWWCLWCYPLNYPVLIFIWRMFAMCFAPFKKFFRQMTNPKFNASSDKYAAMFFCDFINFFIVVFGYKDFGPVVRTDLLVFFSYFVNGWHLHRETLCS